MNRSGPSDVALNQPFLGALAWPDGLDTDAYWPRDATDFGAFQDSFQRARRETTCIKSESPKTAGTVGAFR